MDVSDLPVFETPIFDIDKYIEHRKNFLNELSGLTCSELATNIASDTYSNYGGKAFSDAALAQLEYNYECLGVARPAYNQTNFVAENPRSDR